METYAPPPDPQLTKFFGWFFILSALALGYFTFSRTIDKFTSKSWPSTQAEVLSSTMYESTGRSHVWCIRLRYRYVVGGREFSSIRSSTSIVTRAACDRDRGVIAARIERYQRGAMIKIRYEPSNPERAIVYVDELDLFDFLIPIIVIILFVGGVHAIREGRVMRLDRAGEAESARLHKL